MKRLSPQVRGAVLLLTAALFTAQPVVVGVHHILQPHFWCDEHRSFEHWLEQGEDDTVENGVDALTTAALFSPSENEHHLCPISQMAQYSARLTGHFGAHSDLSYEVAATTPSGSTYQAVPLLSFAPKHSPPSASSRAS